MADQNPTPPVSSFLCYPKFLNGLWTKSASDTETTLTSPTSILDMKSSSSFQNPFKNSPKSTNPNSQIPKSEPEAIGLALIEELYSENSDENFSKSINRMVLFQSELKVQIPVINSSSIFEAQQPKSPADFGIKARNSQISSPFSESLAKNFARQLSLKEMEVSEDYTCVIIHGPNPRTTHIYDDCIVESSSGEDVQSCDQNGSENTGDKEAFAGEEKCFLKA